MAVKPGWIDFKHLRSTLQFQIVLDHYQVSLRVKGDRATGFCPLPTHQGKRNSPSFSVDLVRGIWQCFGCHAKGNVLDFACRMEGLNPDNPRELRQAALKVREIFSIGSLSPQQPERKTSPASGSSRNVLVNTPMDFELQSLDPDHPYLKE